MIPTELIAGKNGPYFCCFLFSRRSWFSPCLHSCSQVGTLIFILVLMLVTRDEIFLPELLLLRKCFVSPSMGGNSPCRAPCPGRVWDQAGEGREGTREQGGQLTSFMLQKIDLKSPFWFVTFPHHILCVCTAPSTERLRDSQWCFHPPSPLMI